MLQSKKQNYHHSKLPLLGEIVYIPKDICNRLNGINAKHNKAIVLSFPLCDNILPYSRGIHTVNVMMLHNKEIKKISGFFLINEDNN